GQASRCTFAQRRRSHPSPGVRGPSQARPASGRSPPTAYWTDARLGAGARRDAMLLVRADIVCGSTFLLSIGSNVPTTPAGSCQRMNLLGCDSLAKTRAGRQRPPAASVSDGGGGVWTRERGGVPTLGLHDCRRTAVRNLVRADVPDKVAMAFTGHRT